MSDDEPITLAEACELYPRSRLTKSTLRAEAARGRLTIFRIGKRDYTTVAFMRDMVRRCQDEDYRRDSISIRQEANGLSETDNTLSAQAALKSVRRGAEARLAAYLAKAHAQARTAPLVADILLVYANEHLPHTRSAKNAAYNVGNLSKWWGHKRLSDLTARNCRAYAAEKTPAAARRDLEVLRAAIGYWHREYGPLPSIPAVTLPPKSAPRERWLTRNEAARLLWAARRTPHLARFILLGIYTGSRSGALLAAQWSWVDLIGGTMHRRAPGTAENAQKRSPRSGWASVSLRTCGAGAGSTAASMDSSFTTTVNGSRKCAGRGGQRHEPQDSAPT